MGYVSVYGNLHSSCVVLKEQREYRPNLHGVPSRVGKIVGEDYMFFYLKDLGSIDTKCFLKYETKICKRIRTGKDPMEWFVLFYEALRSKMTNEVIKLFKSNSISVVAVSSHNNFKLQPLELSGFNAFKAGITAALRIQTESLLRNAVQHEHKLGGILPAMKYA